MLGLSTALPGHTAVFLLGVLSWEPPQGALLASAQLSPASGGASPAWCVSAAPGRGGCLTQEERMAL